MSTYLVDLLEVSRLKVSSWFKQQTWNLSPATMSTSRGTFDSAGTLEWALGSLSRHARSALEIKGITYFYLREHLEPERKGAHLYFYIVLKTVWSQNQPVASDGKCSTRNRWCRCLSFTTQELSRQLSYWVWCRSVWSPTRGVLWLRQSRELDWLTYWLGCYNVKLFLGEWKHSLASNGTQRRT